ncbi:MAG: c-type cytochrome [Pseudomonadota bacterium]|uniref:c-type cytochrome n=1 Tax=Thermithiobacillus tepidarius TaxID=929 RepID=UPI00042176D9|nr:c-type cytochrome [Thermithiobacillus tepidarius]
MNYPRAISALALLGSALILAGCQEKPGEEQARPAAQTAATQSPAGELARGLPPTPAAQSGGKALTYFNPPEKIPDNEFGKLVRQGELIFTDTPTYAKGFAGNGLNCANCHIDHGRQPNSAPLWAAYVSYPAFRKKTGEVNSFEERLQGCFMYSMNGKAPPADSEVMKALVTYAYWMAEGAPVGDTKMAGRGYPELDKPAQEPSAERGAKVFAANCAVCHGANGLGQKASNGKYVFPPLWGPDSFNWGAGMHRINTAAGFIKANMPLGKGGSLSDQDAWDVAAYMNSQPRPQDPRFTGNLAETDKKYHDENCYYGEAPILPRKKG